MLSAPSPDDPVLPSLLSFGTFLGLLIGYGLGYIHAVWRRARGDYNKTRDALPGMRSAKWIAWRLLVQRGAVVVIVLVGLIVWLVVAALNQEPS